MFIYSRLMSVYFIIEYKFYAVFRGSCPVVATEVVAVPGRGGQAEEEGEEEEGREVATKHKDTLFSVETRVLFLTHYNCCFLVAHLRRRMKFTQSMCHFLRQLTHLITHQTLCVL